MAQFCRVRGTLGHKPLTEISFTHQIFPILDRFCQLQWVNKSFNDRVARCGGHAARHDGDFAGPD